MITIIIKITTITAIPPAYPLESACSVPPIRRRYPTEPIIIIIIIIIIIVIIIRQNLRHEQKYGHEDLDVAD